MSWLCCLFRASHSLFFSCKSSDLNSRSCSSFSQRKPTTSELHVLLCFYPQCHFHLATSRFFVSPNLYIGFFSFLELSFFCFRYSLTFFGHLLWFYVYFSSNLSVFKKLLIFRDLLGRYFLFLVLFLTCAF